MSHLQITCQALTFLLLASLPAVADPNSPDTPVKFGFTRSMFAHLNEADTRAAVKSYAALLGSNNDIAVSDSPGILEDAGDVNAAFVQGTADVISLSTIEFLELPPGTTHPRMISASVSGAYAEKYVLLVHKDSGIKTLSDLKNKRLLIYSSLRGALSPLWLDVLLANNHLNEPNRFFASVTPTNKPTRTILPVFFRQADACVVTQNAFTVTCEMNPQLSKDITILATSPDLIPTVTCIRAGITTARLERILKAVVDSQYTVSGRQVLTIFQSDRICEIDDRQLDNVRELISTRARLRDTDPTPTGNTPQPAAP